MNRDETLQYIVDLQFVEHYTQKLIYKEDLPDLNDFIQEIWLQLCEVADEKWSKLWSQGTKNDNAKAVRGYVSGLICRNVKSTNSRLFYRLKKYKIKEIPVSDLSEGEKAMEGDDFDEQ